jgi:hypothetical protein
MPTVIFGPVFDTRPNMGLNQFWVDGRWMYFVLRSFVFKSCMYVCMYVSISVDKEYTTLVTTIAHILRKPRSEVM